MEFHLLGPIMNAETKIKVLLIDDHYVVVEGLSHRLSQEPDIDVCGTAMSFDTALASIEKSCPDVVLLDLSLGEESGLRLIDTLKKKKLSVNVIIYSMHDEMVYASRCMKVGAKGYVMKNKPFDNVIAAIHSVANGGTHFSQEAMKQAMQLIATGDQESELPIDLLSNREFDIFKLIGEGLRPRHIAEKLCISPGTVDSHCKNIRNKLNLDNMTSLIDKAAHWHKQELLP